MCWTVVQPEARRRTSDAHTRCARNRALRPRLTTCTTLWRGAEVLAAPSPADWVAPNGARSSGLFHERNRVDVTAVIRLGRDGWCGGS